MMKSTHILCVQGWGADPHRDRSCSSPTANLPRDRCNSRTAAHGNPCRLPVAPPATQRLARGAPPLARARPPAPINQVPTRGVAGPQMGPATTPDAKRPGPSPADKRQARSPVLICLVAHDPVRIRPGPRHHYAMMGVRWTPARRGIFYAGCNAAAADFGHRKSCGSLIWCDRSAGRICLGINRCSSWIFCAKQRYSSIYSFAYTLTERGNKTCQL